MTIYIKTPEDVAKMRVAGQLAADVLEMIGPHVQPGISTGELDLICHKHIVDKQHAIPAPLHYKGFPKSICTSVNHVICHGIPSDGKILLRIGIGPNGSIIFLSYSSLSNLVLTVSTMLSTLSVSKRRFIDVVVALRY